jgi:hypothetical protein
MNDIAEYLKNYAADLLFVDDRCQEVTPVPKNLWHALRQDRKLLKLQKHHERRLQKPPFPKATSYEQRRGLAVFARFCAWEELYPDADLHEKVWPYIKERLDMIANETD